MSNPYPFDASDRAVASSEAYTADRYNAQVDCIQHLAWGLDEVLRTRNIATAGQYLPVTSYTRGIANLAGERDILLTEGGLGYHQRGGLTPTRQVDLYRRGVGEAATFQMQQPRRLVWHGERHQEVSLNRLIKLPTQCVIRDQVIDLSDDRTSRMLFGGDIFYYGSATVTGAGLATFTVDQDATPVSATLPHPESYAFGKVGVQIGDWVLYRHASYGSGTLRRGWVSNVFYKDDGTLDYILVTEGAATTPTGTYSHTGVIGNFLLANRGPLWFKNCLILAPVVTRGAVCFFENCTFLKRLPAAGSNDPRFFNGRHEMGYFPGHNLGSQDIYQTAHQGLFFRNCDFINLENYEDDEPFFHIFTSFSYNITLSGNRYLSMNAFTIDEPNDVNGRFGDEVQRITAPLTPRGLMLGCQLKNYHYIMQIGSAGVTGDINLKSALFGNAANKNVRLSGAGPTTTLF